MVSGLASAVRGIKGSECHFLEATEEEGAVEVFPQAFGWPL